MTGQIATESSVPKHLHNDQAWYQRWATKLYNFVRYSKPWAFVVAMQLKIPYYAAINLLPVNGIKIGKDKHPLFGYVLGDLTDEAKAKGIARKDLYYPNWSFFRGPRILSLVVAYDDQYFRPMTDVPARAAFNLPNLLARNPELIGRVTHDRILKPQVRAALSSNHDKLWRIVKERCVNLNRHWHDDRCVAENMTQMAFEMMAHFVYDVPRLPEDFSRDLYQFEDQWQNFDKLNPFKFFPILDKFVQTSKQVVEAHMSTSDDTSKPVAERNLVDQMQAYHSQYSSFLKKDNVTALVSIAGNYPRAMIAMVYYILTNPDFVDAINAEKPKLVQQFRESLIKADERQRAEKLKCGIAVPLKSAENRLSQYSDQALIDNLSEEFLRFVYKESDIFRGMFNEVLRVYWLAPVLPRLNTNLFANKIGGWGHDMDLGNGQELPPRSVGFWPKQRKMTDPDVYANPETFDPFRPQYRAEFKEKGKIPSFGAPGGLRRCPAQKMVENMFIATLWHITDSWTCEMVADQRELAKKLPSERDFHHLDLLGGNNAKISASFKPRSTPHDTDALLLSEQQGVTAKRRAY